MGQDPIRIEDLLHKLGINPVEVIVARNGELTPESEITLGEDVIRVYRISHGG
ncbi:MAG: thiamine S protein [Methanomicrobiales archaeon]|nr:thiamine S protein [Methanomicrobiales archaeon]